MLVFSRSKPIRGYEILLNFAMKYYLTWLWNITKLGYEIIQNVNKVWGLLPGAILLHVYETFVCSFDCLAPRTTIVWAHVISHIDYWIIVIVCQSLLTQ